MNEEKKQLEGNVKNTIDWGEFQLEPAKKDEKPSGQVDADLETPVKIKDIAPPADLTAAAPDRPKMMQYLTNYQSARISKEKYLYELKSYAEAQTSIFKDQLEKTVTAHKILTEVSLQGVHEKIRAWAQDITAVTDLSLQTTITKAVTRAAEIADAALKNLAQMDNPHPLVQQQAMKSVVDTLQRTIASIETGGAQIKGRNMNWRTSE